MPNKKKLNRREFFKKTGKKLKWVAPTLVVISIPESVQAVYSGGDIPPPPHRNRHRYYQDIVNNVF